MAYTLTSTLPHQESRTTWYDEIELAPLGIFLITVPNLIVIVLMLMVFAVAIAVPLPQEHSGPADQVSNRPAENTDGGV